MVVPEPLRTYFCEAESYVVDPGMNTLPISKLPSKIPTVGSFAIVVPAAAIIKRKKVIDFFVIDTSPL
jgi:hypothetical protein